MIAPQISADGKSGVLVEINCETDFVARGDAFQKLAGELVNQVFQSKAATAEAVLAENALTNPAMTVDAYIKDSISLIKENLALRRFARFELSTPGMIHAYIHLGSKLGVLLELTAPSDTAAASDRFKQLAKDLGMHIASVAPEFVSRDEVSASVIEEEKRIEMGKEDLQSKPEAIREKIVMGRIDKLIAQRVLLEQPFVKDPSKTITELLAEISKELGGPVQITRFVRFLLGEGIEKAESNFADEVMAQMKG